MDTQKSGQRDSGVAGAVTQDRSITQSYSGVGTFQNWRSKSNEDSEKEDNFGMGVKGLLFSETEFHSISRPGLEFTRELLAIFPPQSLEQACPTTFSLDLTSSSNRTFTRKKKYQKTKVGLHEMSAPQFQ